MLITVAYYNRDISLTSLKLYDKYTPIYMTGLTTFNLYAKINREKLNFVYFSKLKGVLMLWK